MCGIFGATERERFKTLYELNRTRGDFAFGCCLITHDRSTQYIDWQPGVVDSKDDLFTKENKYSYMLGHTQAPTSAKREFSERTSHPFVESNWVVAHNGVLSNFKYLKEKFMPEWDNPVDSSIIPVLLTALENDANSEVTTLKQTMEELEGTYSLWIYNTYSKNLYIARCGSTLYFNALENEFSSIMDKNMKPVPDNTIHQITREGITLISGFDGNSPFLII
jgi:glucosamine 6-phosphate synthetase-like amidotransferase/phosphosugar isomerase protein